MKHLSHATATDTPVAVPEPWSGRKLEVGCDMTWMDRRVAGRDADTPATDILVVGTYRDTRYEDGELERSEETVS